MAAERADIGCDRLAPDHRDAGNAQPGELEGIRHRPAPDQAAATRPGRRLRIRPGAHRLSRKTPVSRRVPRHPSGRSAGRWPARGSCRCRRDRVQLEDFDPRAAGQFDDVLGHLTEVDRLDDLALDAPGSSARRSASPRADRAGHIALAGRFAASNAVDITRIGVRQPEPARHRSAWSR